MATVSFERIIRPRIPPRIRPSAVAQALPEDDAESGVARITGSGGQAIILQHSYSSTQSRQRQTELKRKFDLVRVKNPDDTEQHVDLEVTHKLQMRTALGLTSKYNLAKPPEAANVEVLEEDQERDSNIPVN